MKIIYFIFYSFFVLVLLAIASLFVVPLLPIDNNIQIKIVESGSMEPSIKTGSLVVIRPLPNYQKGDVITFNSVSADVPTTHRIIEVRGEGKEKFFMTKGDANEDPDSVEASLRSVIGKVVLSVPYIGFILDFARQPIGFALLIVLPALMIILGEIEKIWKETQKRRKKSVVAFEGELEPEMPQRQERRSDMVRMMEIACPVYREQYVPTTPAIVLPLQKKTSFRDFIFPVSIVLVSVLVTAGGFVGDTVSYFNDTESSILNKLQASLLDFTADSEGPAYTFLDTSDSVVIVTTLASEEDSLLVDYEVKVEKISGDAFCNALIADAGAPIIYTGPLLALTAMGVTLETTWDLTLSIDPLITNYLPQEVCVADVVLTAWYKDGETGAGYSDEEKVRLTLTAPNTVAPIVAPFNALFIPEQVTDGDSQEGEALPQPSGPQEPITPPEEIVEGDTLPPEEDTDEGQEEPEPEPETDPNQSILPTEPIDPETPEQPTI